MQRWSSESPEGPPKATETNLPSGARTRKQWHSRGRLPHWEAGEVPQHIHFHLVSSVPRRLAAAWREELENLGDTRRERIRKEWIRKALASDPGECWLADSRIADIVEGCLLHFDGRYYRLHAWVVMPNHVHVLCTPIDGHSLSQIVFSWKSFTATKANQLLGRKGSFWMEEYFDRMIRDQDDFSATVAYIEGNPVHAGLCEERRQWPHSSARGSE